MRKMRGFTLLELIVVIVIIGVIAAVLTVFLRPAIQGYLDTNRRAALSDMADTALRRISQDVRRAVPNSLRTYAEPGCQSVQLVPTVGGGRYRMGPDVLSADTTSYRFIDPTRATTQFDVFNFMRVLPVDNPPGPPDWVVINNQNTNDVYTGVNRSAARTALTPASTSIEAGQHRIIVESHQFPSGYDGGRFQLVSGQEQTVIYNCVAGGLFRTVAPFSTTLGSAACNSSAGQLVAENVSACEFLYDPNHGATQQSGFLRMTLHLAAEDEVVALIHGVHVENVP